MNEIPALDFCDFVIELLYSSLPSSMGMERPVALLPQCETHLKIRTKLKPLTSNEGYSMEFDYVAPNAKLSSHRKSLF